MAMLSDPRLFLVYCQIDVMGLPVPAVSCGGDALTKVPVPIDVVGSSSIDVQYALRISDRSVGGGAKMSC